MDQIFSQQDSRSILTVSLVFPGTMKFSSTSFTFFLTLVAAAAPVSLPACSTGSGTPCKCPAGSEYGESVTFTVIGAAAKDVTALTSDCTCAFSLIALYLGEHQTRETLTVIQSSRPHGSALSPMLLPDWTTNPALLAARPSKQQKGPTTSLRN